MTLAAGVRLGAYDILALIGAGGMGEVYKARDTRLDRIVAIKILPETLAADPQFRDRFDREARAISQLDHPHICTLYDVGDQDGTSFLVMQYLEGETLADRLGRSNRLRQGYGGQEDRPLPMHEALAIAIQIASALDRAHRSGITHRDLKPGNIMLTKGGAKLLDFGLAKHRAGWAGTAGGAGEGRIVSGVRLQPDLPPPPTMTSPITVQGTILGTFQFMAPEQLEGLEADARTDIFAFGAVLYEMLTGKPAFQGKSHASLISAIMTSQPAPIATLQPLSPPLLDHIVSRCLAKDPDERWQTASDVMRELRWVSETAPQLLAGPTARGTGQRQLGSVLLGSVAGVLVASGFWLFAIAGRQPAQTPRPLVRFAIDMPAATNGVWASPDGQTFLFSAPREDTSTPLYIRRLDEIEPVLIRGTDGASSPSFSPDGQWIVFFVANPRRQLKKISLSGGPSVVVADVPDVAGTTWGPDNTIIFGSRDGLQRVPAAGGEPRVITKVDATKKETGHLWPQILPSGRAVLFAASFGPGAEADLTVKSLESDAQQVLAQGSYPRVGPGGELIFARMFSLWAGRLDELQMSLNGEPVHVLEGVQTQLNGLADFDVSRDGTLVYGRRQGGSQQLVWLDPNGQGIPATDERLAGQYHPSPQLSPDGSRLAVTTHPEGSDDQVVVYDLERGVRTPLRSASGANSRFPVWTPDATKITFASSIGGSWDIYWQSASGTAPPEPLLIRELDQIPGSWSPDGQVLAFTERGVTSGIDIWTLPLRGQPSVFVNTPFAEDQPTFSPNGKWLAYRSNESGVQEVYVQSYPGPGEKLRVSAQGGGEPRWSRDGTTLFYRQGERSLISVSVQAAPTLRLGAPRQVLQESFGTETLYANYDVAPDGRRFIAIRDLAAGVPSFVVVQHWFEELKRLVPSK